ncbi:hypothetical protein CERZMDRAFT_86838 [Cercospora zeae-maydis SCOH1-5]|uniref:Uncharacterized protein n=1 Tax=Cercospora zeae-maydis SCOH1-5 TaxID=717836 RepID=A0A6A6F6L0_9PEZI|nr:hypothetical protein CERZMDRAFT_86838 [Cercospora zeae-maydis SCOH1-5]
MPDRRTSAACAIDARGAAAAAAAAAADNDDDEMDTSPPPPPPPPPGHGLITAPSKSMVALAGSSRARPHALLAPGDELKINRSSGTDVGPAVASCRLSAISCADLVQARYQAKIRPPITMPAPTDRHTRLDDEPVAIGSLARPLGEAPDRGSDELRRWCHTSRPSPSNALRPCIIPGARDQALVVITTSLPTGSRTQQHESGSAMRAGILHNGSHGASAMPTINSSCNSIIIALVNAPLIKRRSFGHRRWYATRVPITCGQTCRVSSQSPCALMTVPPTWKDDVLSKTAHFDAHDPRELESKMLTRANVSSSPTYRSGTARRAALRQPARSPWRHSSRIVDNMRQGRQHRSGSHARRTKACAWRPWMVNLRKGRPTWTDCCR